jgi:hypothetical protein
MFASPLLAVVIQPLEIQVTRSANVAISIERIPAVGYCKNAESALDSEIYLSKSMFVDDPGR